MAFWDLCFPMHLKIAGIPFLTLGEEDGRWWWVAEVGWDEQIADAICEQAA